MKRRITLTLILTALICLLLSVSAEATTVASGTCGDNVTWELGENGTLTITGTGKMNNFFSGYSTPWTKYRNDICEVVISEGITHIGNHAFDNCDSLKEVPIPDSVTSIGDYGFAHCGNLTSIALPDSVTSVGFGAFTDCMYLKSVDFGNSVATIEEDAFSLCSSLKAVSFPKSLSYIGYGAFARCSSLRAIAFTGSAPNISTTPSDPTLEPTFFNVTAKVLYPAGDTSWTNNKCANYGGNLTWLQPDYGVLSTGLIWDFEIDGTLTFYGTSAIPDFSDFNDVPWYPYRNHIRKLVISNGATSIGSYAFYNCDNLKSVTIPDSVTIIGNYAFYNCCTIPSIAVPNSVASIGSYAFYNCDNLKSVTISGSATTIGDHAFMYCDSLESIAIDNSATTIGDHAFTGCDALKSISMGNSVTTIGSYAFSHCNAIQSVTIPSSVATIGRSVFYSCDAMKEIIFTGSAPYMYNLAFESVSVTAYYPSGDTSWTEGKRENYGGTIKWVAIQNPGFLAQPTDVFKYIGEDAVFSVRVVGDGLVYSWQYRSPDGSWYNAIAEGFDTDTLTIPINAGLDGYQYRCVVTDKSGKKATSNVATLSIAPNLAITKQPANAVGAVGDIATFTITVQGVNLTYRWQQRISANGEWTDVSGGTAAAHSVPLTAARNGYQFRCIVTDKRGDTVTSEVVTLAIGIPLVITQQPANTTVTASDSATFAVVAEGTDLIYTWQYKAPGGEWIDAGCSASTLRIAAPVTMERNGYQYRCIISNDLGTVTSDVATLGVNPILLSTGTCGDNLTWALDTNGILSISGTGDMWNFDDGTPWRRKAAEITTVIIHDGVTSIGDCAFCSCESLTEISIPDSVTTIGNSAFSWCLSLLSVAIPDSVTSVGNNAFNFCINLTEIAIPDSVISIGDSAFNECNSLAEIAIPDSVTSIGHGTFFACYSLTEITLPDSIIAIGNSVFLDCRSLTEIRFEGNVPSFGREAFGGATATVYYPYGDDSWTADVRQNYGGNMTWKPYGIPAPESSVVLNEQGAPALSWAEVRGAQEYTVAIYTDDELVATETVTGTTYTHEQAVVSTTYTYIVTAVVDGVAGESSEPVSVTTPEVFLVASGKCGNNLTWTLDENGLLTISGTGAMWDYNATYKNDRYGTTAPWDGNTITSVVLGESVTSVGSAAFTGCTVQSIIIPGSITAIGNDAFYFCDSLRSVTIGNSVTFIGNRAFAYCDNLKSIYFTGGAPTIGGLAFINVTATAYYPYGDKSWNELTKKNYSGNLTWVTIIASGKYGDNLNWDLTDDGTLTITGTGKMDSEGYVGSAPWYAYRDTIKKVVVADGITSVGDYAFHRCSALTDITLPNTVTSIGEHAFSYCSSLKTIALPSMVDTIGYAAFAYCDVLNTITIPEGVSTLEGHTFCGCTALRSVSLPSSLSEIKFRAFYLCTSLSSLELPAEITSIGEEAFGECPSLQELAMTEDGSYYCIRDGVLFNADRSVIVHYPAGKTETAYIIPSTVTTIARFAFEKCSRLTSVVIPDSVATIGDSAFNNCTAIETVTIPSGVDTIGFGAFANCSSLNTITFVGSAPEIASTALMNVTATAYYPAGDGSWINGALLNYGGNITWVAKSALQIIGQTTGAQVFAGEKVTFTVQAQGTGLTYQWQYKTATGKTWNNSTTGNPKTATLTVEATEKRNGYQYRCIVTDANGQQVISDAATLTVVIKTPLQITDQPTSTKASEGEKVAFTVQAQGEGLTYQWQYKTATGKTWNNSSTGNPKTDTLTVEATEKRNGYQYRCIVTDANGQQVISDAATLTVVIKTPLQITDQPTNVKASVGEKVTFTVKAQGESITYQWQYKTATGKTWNNSSTGNPKTATLTVEATEKRTGYQYRCIVTDADGQQVITDAATLTVITKIPLAITGQPISTKASVGEKVSFTVQAQGESISYQWQYKSSASSGWSNSSSGKTATLSVEALSYRNGYQYRCKITDGINTVYSDAATLTVITKTPLAITGQPENVTADLGEKVTFAVDAQGDNLTYQWYYKTATGSSWNKSTTGNPKTDTLTVEATEKRNGYQYRCEVADQYGDKITSDAATLTVEEKEEVFAIIGQPDDADVAVGETATFTVTATGSGLTYQWQYKAPGNSWKNSSAAGSKTASFSVEGLTYRDGYRYRCEITDANGAVLYSDVVFLSVD